jgi:hypothetical protein
MVLISIHPFAFRKLFLIVVAFLCFSTLCFADPVLMVRRYSARPDLPKASMQVESPSFDALEKGVLGNAASLIGPNNPDIGAFSASVRNPACVLRSTILTDSPPADAPVLGRRKI